MIAIVVGVSSLWLAAKWLSVLVDRGDWWDLADFAAGALGGVAVFALLITVRGFQSGAANGIPRWTVPLRDAALVAYALGLGFWMASAWIETDLDVDVPDDLEPMEDRIWAVHLGWIPIDMTSHDE